MIADFTFVMGSGDQTITDNTIEIKLKNSEFITIPVKTFTFRAPQQSGNDKIESQWSPKTSNEEETWDFMLEPCAQITSLTNDIFEVFISFLNNNSIMRGRLASICELLNAGDLVLNNSHFCSEFDYLQTLQVKPNTLDQLLLLNIKLSAIVGDKEFGLGYLLTLNNRGDKLEFDYQNTSLIFTSLLVNFAFQKGSSNILGMNFLDKKIIFVDYQFLTVRISECPFSTEECDSQSINYVGVPQRAFKLAIDITVFILLVSLIFGLVISFDKFMNEDEYVKE